jgi:hypothetical protein
MQEYNINDITNKNDQLENQLNLIRYQTKKTRIREILENPNQVAINDNSIKNGRMWLVGFLNHVGYSEVDIQNIIKTYNKWEDYKEEETNRQVRWLINRKHTSVSKTEQLDQCTSVVFTQAIETSENIIDGNIEESNNVKSDDIIDLFFDTCKPISLNPPRNINDAIIYYHNRGFHMIPKIRDEKRPAVKWKIYQENQPPLYIVKRWNFNHGIILLGTKMHSFLDVDMKSAKHDKGLEDFDESRLKGWYYERTQNGGYHIFGSGFFPKGMTGLVNDAVQIKHLGGYIVAYPTSGYMKSQM